MPSEVAEAITTYPIPLPVGTRVRFIYGSHKGREGVLVHKAADPNGLTADVFLDNGQVEKGYYALSGGYTEERAREWVEVLALPGEEMAFPKYTLLTHASPNANQTPGKLGACYGIAISQKGSTITVKRVGIEHHLALGLQDWDVSDCLPVDVPPMLTADERTLPLGGRVRFSPDGEDGDVVTGTICAAFEPSFYVLHDEGTRYGEGQYADPTLTRQSMWSPAKVNYELLTEQREQVGETEDGTPVYLGDEVEYISGSSQWVGSRFRVIGTFTDSGNNVEFLEVSPHLEGDYEVGSVVSLDWDRFRVIPHLPTAVSGKPQLGNLEYPDGTPICEGDEVIWTGKVNALDAGDEHLLGQRATAFEANAAVSKVLKEDGKTTCWHSTNVRKVGTPTGLSYADGQPICYGDRVVMNPGTEFAGQAGTVLYQEGEYEQYLRVITDEHRHRLLRDSSTISRLQDEDKEKLTDDVPKPTPALEALEQALAEVQASKEALEEAVSNIETELDNAEGATPDVTFDEDTIRNAVSVSTSNQELLGLISYDGEGGLSIDDSAVDEHARDTLNVDTSYIEYEVTGGATMEDLHRAFATGQERVNRLLEALTDAVTIVQQIAETVPVEVAEQVLIVPEVETFEGIIRNARFGAVLPEDAETGPALRFDVVAECDEDVSGEDGSHTKPTRRVRLVGRQIGTFLATVAVSDVKLLEGRKAILQQDDMGGFWPTHIAEVPEVDAEGEEFEGEEF